MIIVVGVGNFTFSGITSSNWMFISLKGFYSLKKSQLFIDQYCVWKVSAFDDPETAWFWAFDHAKASIIWHFCYSQITQFFRLSSRAKKKKKITFMPCKFDFSTSCLIKSFELLQRVYCCYSRIDQAFVCRFVGFDCFLKSIFLACMLIIQHMTWDFLMGTLTHSCLLIFKVYL